LNEPTHEIINEQAARQSRPDQPGLDQVLKEQLEFPGGIEEPVGGLRVFQWLRKGGELEDEGGFGATLVGDSRFFRHFHDPLYQADGSGRGLWDQAGLTFLGQHESSIQWMQRPNQDVQAARTGNFSWQNARQYFLTALTGTTSEEREENFALTFRALGQVMHLVVDASVPLHVRNDAHPLGPLYGNYEYWAEAEHGLPDSPEEQNFINTFLSNPFTFDASILQQPTNDTKAPVPIARLIDTDTYTGSDPNVTLGDAIGIAEFGNANFFSENTGDGQYPFPNVNTLIPTQRQTVQTARIRAYYTKAPGDGVPVDPVLAECLLDELALAEGLDLTRIGTCTDENVWAQVAQVMLPRAVGYAAGVLDYFFRGTLDFTVSTSATPPNQILTITNTSAEAMDGTFTLYADNFSGGRSPVAGASFNLTLGPGATSGHLSFTPPSQVQAYVLVFQGQLGNEAGAVAGKVNDWFAVTDVTPSTITPGQATTITITIKSNFSRQPRALVAALLDANASQLASTAVIIPNTGPTTTMITLDITSNTIPANAPRPISLVVASDVDIGSITTTDLNAQNPVDVVMNLVRVGQNSRLPIYQRVVTGKIMWVSGPNGSSSITFLNAFDTTPFTFTWKFKNANLIKIFVAPIDNRDDFTDGKPGRSEFTGTQADFSSFTISFVEPGVNTVGSFMIIDADLTDGFLCISDVVSNGSASEISFHRFTRRECPE
jgi:hypothetical protein